MGGIRRGGGRGHQAGSCAQGFLEESLRGKPPTAACKVPKARSVSPRPYAACSPGQSTQCLLAETELQTCVLPPQGPATGARRLCAPGDFRRLYRQWVRPVPRQPDAVLNTPESPGVGRRGMGEAGEGELGGKGHGACWVLGQRSGHIRRTCLPTGLGVGHKEGPHGSRTLTV